MGMTERDRKVMAAALVLVVLGAFWFLIISPKRTAVAEAEKAKQDAQASLDTAKQAEIAAKAVKKEKPEEYAKLIKLGAAIPTNDDFASLLVQIDDISNDANVQFVDLTASTTAGGGGSTDGVGGSSCEPEGGASGATGVPSADPSAATGATGSSAPAGATAQTWVGRDKAKAQDAAADANARNAATSDAAACATAPTLADLSAQAAGLDKYSYTLTFKGSFFNLDTMFGDLLGLVKTHNGRVTVNGRLLDINSINLAVSEFPQLSATVQMTGYSMPLGGSAAAAPAAPAAPGVPAASTTGQ